jgi:hypothetical protein
VPYGKDVQGHDGEVRFRILDDASRNPFHRSGRIDYPVSTNTGLANSNRSYFHGNYHVDDDQLYARYRKTDSEYDLTGACQVLSSVMLYAGAVTITVWGLAHIVIPTKSIVDGFGPMTADNRRILLMEWLMEGVLLVFLGILVAFVRYSAPAGEIAATIVYRASAVVLIVMAGISLATGARTRIGPMKLCPPIFAATAVLFWLATVS